MPGRSKCRRTIRTGHKIPMNATDSDRSNLALRLQGPIRNGRVSRTILESLPSKLSEQWHDALGGGDADLLSRRLRWDDEFQPLADEITGRPSDWIKTLENLFVFLESQTEDCPSPPKNPVGFDEVLIPIASLAEHTLAAECPVLAALSRKVRDNLTRPFLERLSFLTCQTLDLEFKLARELWQFEGLSQSKDSAKESRRLYQRYVASLQGEKIASLFELYPVLGYLIVNAVRMWVEAHTLFLNRLAGDGPILKHRVVDGSFSLSNIEEISPPMSDPHNGGQTTLIVKNKQGERLVYKPRSLAVDSAFSNLVEELNRLGAANDPDFLGLKTARVLERDGYGWAEYIDTRPCPATELNIFYERSGMLACLMYLLGEVDAQYENLIACGTHPVLVDIEAIMHSQVQGLRGQSAHEAENSAWTCIYDSVLRTGLFPLCLDTGSARVDTSGLGGSPGQETQFTVFKWKNINSDAMVLESGEAQSSAKNNNPGMNVRPEDYRDAIVAGFCKMYELWMANAGALVDEDGLLGSFANVETRFIFRPTSFYSMILRRAVHPHYLSTGAAQFKVLNTLSKALVQEEEPPSYWPLLWEELSSLQRHDIPRFSTTPSQKGVQGFKTGTIPRVFETSGLDRVRKRVDGMSLSDCARQAEIICCSLSSLSSSRRVLPTVSASAEPKLPSLHETIEWIAEHLADRAVTSPRGELAWISPAGLPVADPLELAPVGPSLYDGTCGIAVFFAAMFRCGGEPRWADVALRAVATLRRSLSSKDSIDEVIEREGIGGAVGLYSIIYGLVLVSVFLHDDDLLEIAVNAALAVDCQRIFADEKFDVVYGSAGALLSILAVHGCSGDSRLIERASSCAAHMMQQRSKVETGELAWRQPTGQVLTGFSHGTSGCAYALTKLHERLPGRELLEAAETALLFERRSFSSDHGAWRDLRFKTPQYPVSWCHGAVGIGLARLAMSKSAPGPEWRDELQVALRKVETSPAHITEQLCCGNAGRIDFLISASGELGEPHFLEVARQQISQLLRRKQTNGGIRLFTDLPVEITNPSLFCGLAGVGYTLLRSIHPSLPSVISWQAPT